MKKNTLRVMALILCLILVIGAFAACGPNKDVEPESSNGPSEVVGTDDTTTEPPIDTTTKEGDTTVAPAPLPSDRAGIIKFYNDNFGKLKISSYNRKMEKGILTVVKLDVVINLLEEADAKPRVETLFNSTAISEGLPLAAITADQVADATKTADGYQIKLKDYSGGTTTQAGGGGYALSLNFDNVKRLIIAVANGFPLKVDIAGIETTIILKESMLDLQSVASKMSQGVIDLKVSDGKVTEISVTSLQNADIIAKGQALKIKIDIVGDAVVRLKASYK